MRKILAKLNIPELLKFCVGGGSAVVVDLTMYMLLKPYISVSPAKTTSFVAGAIVGFIINKLWTFESSKFKVSEIAKYVVLYACSATVNTVVNAIVLSVSGWTILAYLCATGTSTIMNYWGLKFIVFRKNSHATSNS